MNSHTLENFWNDDTINGKILEPTEILRQITELFEAIHSKGNVHGELTPSEAKRSDDVIIEKRRKLSNKLNATQPMLLANKSFSEWRPAEERDYSNSEWKPTKEGDIFNLGCYFYYIITGGQHPFGSSGQRISFIANNLYDLSGCQDKLLEKLIKRMISRDPKTRPTCSELLLRHPYLWKREKIEEYIYNRAKQFNETNDQYLKLKDNFLLPSSQMSTVKSILEILVEIKEQQETPLNACNMFPDFLSSLFVTYDFDNEFLKEPNADESRPIIFKNLLIANDSFGEIGPFKRRHGRFGLQPVHVMEFLQTSTDICDASLSSMKRLACSSHPNLLKYFYVGENSEEDSSSERLIILACEPFDETLETLLKKKDSLNFETAKDILNQITAGLLEYHSKNLVHGNITSSQLAIFNNSENIIAKIAKFPIYDETERPSMKNDIRRLGQIYLDLFKQVEVVPPICHHLIQAMKSTRDECVPPCEAIFYHPFFWSSEEIADFLLVAGDFYKDNPNIDRISILEKNQQNMNSNQEFQHLKTNRSAIEYFLSQTTSDSATEEATVALAVELTRQYPTLVIQTWLKLQKYKSMDCGLDLEPFYCTTYDFPNYEKLRDDREHALEGTGTSCDSSVDQKKKTEEIVCQEKVTLSLDEDEGYHSVSMTSFQSEPDFIIDQFSISNPAERQLNTKWSAEMSSGANHPIQRYLSNYVHQWEVAQEDHPNRIMKHPVIDPFERTAMHLACHSDDFYILAERLLELGSNPDAVDKNGYAPLHVAAEKKAIQITELLIEKRATIDVRAKNSTTPLFFAAISNSPRTIKLLIKNNADVTKLDNFGRSPLHYAVATNSNENVDLLLLKPLKSNTDCLRKIVDAVDIDGMSPLHIAVANNSIEMVEYLLKKYKANPNVGKLDGTEFNIQPIEKKIPVLQLAVGMQLYDVIDLLLKEGADPNITDLHGQTALHIAALRPPSPDRLKIMDRLIKNNEIWKYVNAVDNVGRTALYAATFNGADDIVQRLLECQPHIEVDKREKEREITPLHLAAWKNFENITEMLITKGNARVDARDKNGDTPLEYAASSNAINVAEQLLKAGASAKTKRWNSRSPLHVAAAHNARQVGELLISKDADVNARDNLEFTPLHYAEYCGNDGFVELLHTKDKDNRSSTADQPVSKQLTPTELKSVRQLTNGFILNNAPKIQIMLPPIVAQFNDVKLEITQGLIIDGFQSN